MLIKSFESYLPQLIPLWQETFGDEKEDIITFFESLKDEITVFAFFDGKKLVSALYLINSQIIENGKKYNGFYLYAAATLPSYRNKGIMSSLIKEALDYSKDSTKDYITLLPAEEKLYNYYEKFGFKSNLYRFQDNLESFGEMCLDIDILSDFNEFFSKRAVAGEYGIHLYNGNVNAYAQKFYKNCGVDFARCEDVLFLIDRKNFIIYELLSDKSSYNVALNKLSKALPKGKYKVYAPYGRKAIKFGMICPLSLKADFLADKKIYMNIAFD